MQDLSILVGTRSSNYYTAHQMPMKRKHQPSEKTAVGVGFPFDEAPNNAGAEAPEP